MNQKGTMKNTKISYMYRDADNYKAYNDEVFAGILMSFQVKEIMSKCDSDNHFIPEQVDMVPLQKQLQCYDTKDWDVDHPWHELLEIEQVDIQPTSKILAQKLYENFMKIKMWNDAVETGHVLNK